MNRLKMKTTATLLIAIFMISAFAVAIPVFAYQAEVWVDDDYTSSTPGWGVSHFATIQEGVDAIAAGQTVHVAAGTYAEEVIISRSMTLLGAKAGEDARARDTGTGESILDGSTIEPYLLLSAFKISDAVTDVTIDGFEIHSYYTHTSPHSSGSGNAISAYFDQGQTVGTSDITVVNNYMYDLSHNAILVGNEEGFTQSGWLIQYNLIEDSCYAGIELTNVVDSDVLDNKIVAPNVIDYDPGDAGVGIEIAVRARLGQTITGGTVLVEGNEITGAFPSTSRAGINLLSRAYTDTSSATLSGVTVRENIISCTTVRAGILVAAEPKVTGASATISGTAVNYNNLIDNTIRVENAAPGTLDATMNWWGTTVETEIEAMIVGDVYFSPILDLDPALSVGLTADVTLVVKQVSISVTPPDVDFGTPIPGKTVVKPVRVRNTGDLAVDVTATLEDEVPVDFYTDYLQMYEVSAFVPVVDWDLTLAYDAFEDVDLQLSIPDPCLLGSKTATLVFEAVAPPPTP